MVLAVQFLFSAQEFFQDHSYKMGRPITMRFLFLTQSLIHHTIAAQSIHPVQRTAETAALLRRVQRQEARQNGFPVD